MYQNINSRFKKITNCYFIKFLCGVYMEFCKVKAMMGIQLDYTDKIHYYFENVRLILFDEIL